MTIWLITAVTGAATIGPGNLTGSWTAVRADVSEAAAKYRAKRCGPPQRIEVKDIQIRQTMVLPFDR